MSHPLLKQRYGLAVPRQRARKEPNRWVEDGRWPHARISKGAPPSTELVQGIAHRLSEALKYKSKHDPGRVTAREAAEAAGVSPATITNIINGITWPDADSIARLEKAFDIDLWGDEHRKKGD